MARTKSPNAIKVNDDAVEAVARINLIDKTIADLDLKEADAIARVRDTYAKKRVDKNCSNLEAEKKVLLKELEVFAKMTFDSWKSKTFTTPFGKFGYRRSGPKVVLIKTVVSSATKAIELLRKKMPKLVSTKHSINKKAINVLNTDGSLDLEKLQKCGLAIENKDEFFVESNAAKDLGEAEDKLKAA